MTSRFIKLANRGDVYNFYVGAPVEGALNARGQFVPHTFRQLLLARLRAKCARLTRWWRPRHVVTRIDRLEGGIRIAEQNWSWRHWRWM